MGRHDQRRPELAGDRTQNVRHGKCIRSIDGRGRLVGENHLRSVDDGAGYSGSLAFPYRKLIGTPFEILLDPQIGGQFSDPVPVDRIPKQLQGQGDVFADRQIVKQPTLLKNVAGMSCPQIGKPVQVVVFPSRTYVGIAFFRVRRRFVA